MVEDKRTNQQSACEAGATYNLLVIHLSKGITVRFYILGLSLVRSTKVKTKRVFAQFRLHLRVCYHQAIQHLSFSWPTDFFHGHIIKPHVGHKFMSPAENEHFLYGYLVKTCEIGVLLRERYSLQGETKASRLCL